MPRPDADVADLFSACPLRDKVPLVGPSLNRKATSAAGQITNKTGYAGFI